MGNGRRAWTTFKLQHDIDTGNILLQEAFPIGEEETAGEVHDRMKEIGARVLVQTVDGLVAERSGKCPRPITRAQACSQDLYGDLQNRLEQAGR